MRPDPQALLLAGGAFLCVLAILWRATAHHRQTARLLRHLEGAAEPEERARAGQAFIDLGLRRAATPVLHAMQSEPDDRVRLSVALAVARRQWEPTRPARVASLRRWAGDELDLQGHPVASFGPAVTRLADMGGPRLPESARTTPTEVPPAPPLVTAADAPTVVMDRPAPEAPPRPDAPARGSEIRWAAPRPTSPGP